MADENRLAEAEFVADLHDVIGISGEIRVFGGIVGREIGAAGADMIEQDRPETAFERRRHVAPHVLVAAEAMREHHGPFAMSRDVDVVTCASRHGASRPA